MDLKTYVKKTNWMLYESKLISAGYEVDYRLKKFFCKVEKQVGKEKMTELIDKGIDYFEEIKLKFPYLKASIMDYPHPSMFLVKEVRKYIYNKVKTDLAKVLDKFPTDETILKKCLSIYKYRNKKVLEELVKGGFSEKTIIGTLRKAERMCGAERPDAEFYKWAYSVIKQV